MIRHEGSGYELDPEKDRLDLDRVERWLAVESYWATGRERGRIERSIAESDTWGLYSPSGEQAGFFRVVTDHATFAWLCDVYVDKEHRGLGLSHWAVQIICDEVMSLGLKRMLLGTLDAHGVYAKVGFTPLVSPERWMELRAPE